MLKIQPVKYDILKLFFQVYKIDRNVNFNSAVLESSFWICETKVGEVLESREWLRFWVSSFVENLHVILVSYHLPSV